MLFNSPQQFASWDDPIAMLYACHSKVKRFCHQLQILPDYLQKHGCNQAVKNDVQQILNYFNLSAPLHHDDEEKEFFPALMKQIPQAQKTVDELEAEHIILHQNWTALSAQLQDLLLEKSTEVDAVLIENFVKGYEKHIALEEPLFELGKQHLSAEELQAMGKIMAARRKI